MNATEKILPEIHKLRAASVPTRDQQPLYVVLSGAQGSGKTTLTKALEAGLTEAGLSVVAISLDDFYLSKEDRKSLAAKMNIPLLETRGVPGTHDLGSLGDFLEKLFSSREKFHPLKFPCKFSKALDDRVSCDVVIETRPDVVILEGWCFGAVGNPDPTPKNELEEFSDSTGEWRKFVNANIPQLHKCVRWDRLKDRGGPELKILLKVPSWAKVLEWRKQQAVQNGEDVEKISRFCEFFQRFTLSVDSTAFDLVLELDDSHNIKF